MTEFERFTDIVAMLRSEHGCPWDKEQTHVSLKRYCIEEAAEVVAGINIYDRTGNCENLCEELGDLLLQIVLHAQIAKEEGLFSIDDVVRGISDKMVRRHPHVFEGTKYDTGSSAGVCAGPENDGAAGQSSGPNAGNEAGQSSGPNAGSGAGQNNRPDNSSAEGEPGRSMPSIGEINRTWEEIKQQEKKGHEWMDAYLPEAFTESGEMLELARRRKEEKVKTRGAVDSGGAWTPTELNKQG